MESTLALPFADFVSEVGQNLGWGRGASAGDTAYTSRRQLELNSIVTSGLRQFYWPQLPPPLLTYHWSFMRPHYSMTLPEATTLVDLPHDFGGFEGETVLTASNRTNLVPVRIFDEVQVAYAFAQYPEQQGAPQKIAAQAVRQQTRTAGQRYKLYAWPTPDQDYTLTFKYYVLPDALTSTHPYHYGGAQHAETVLESCLAIAEERLDDMKDGPHGLKYKERLLASIGLDQRLKPQYMGRNMDRSDDWLDRRQYQTNGPVTWNGQTP